MKVTVAGGSGWLGTAVCRALADDGHDVVVLSRSSSKPTVGRRVQWDGRTQGPWTPEIDAADAVLSFTGESIARRRWTAERKRQLVSSRLEPTAALVEAMAATAQRPAVLVSASAVGYYGDRGDEVVSEESSPGSDFLARLVAEWEAAALAARASDVRVVLLRIAPVLGPGGQLLPRLLVPFRLFCGGPIGSGRQWFPWVHIEDVVGMVRLALADERLSGPINVVAPQMVTMETFATTLGRALGRPSWLHVPRLALRMAFGELGDSLVFSQRVEPGVAQGLGYEFREAELLHALRRALGASGAN